MSKIKHSLRLMIIDIEQDKVVVDEFCDAVVAGFAQSREATLPQKGEIAACKCGFMEGMFAVEAAEGAIRTQKNKIVKTFMDKAGPEEIKKVLGIEETEEVDE